MIFVEFTLETAMQIRTILLYILVGVLIFGAIWLFMKARKMEMISAKQIYIGYALFAFTFALTRIFFQLALYFQQVQNSYPESSYDYIFNMFITHLFISSAHMVMMICLIFIFRVVEKYILNRKPIFIFLAIGAFLVDLLAVVLIVIDLSLYVSNRVNLDLFVFQMNVQNLEPLVQEIVLPILGIAICSLYYIIAKNSAGDVKKQATSMFTGIIIFALALLMDMSFLGMFTAFNPIRQILSPLLFIIALLVFFKSLK